VNALQQQQELKPYPSFGVTDGGPHVKQLPDTRVITLADTLHMFACIFRVPWSNRFDTVCPNGFPITYVALNVWYWVRV